MTDLTLSPMKNNWWKKKTKNTKKKLYITVLTNTEVTENLFHVIWFFNLTSE